MDAETTSNDTKTLDGFFELRATHNRHRWHLPVKLGLTVGPPGHKFLFGGVGLASAIRALEQTTGRPVIWATAQYLSFANPPDIVDVDVIVHDEDIVDHLEQVRGRFRDQERQGERGRERQDVL